MKNKKTILFSLLLLTIVLTACETEQPAFLIVEKQGTTITNSIINNITNNITNAGSNITNNITNNYTLGNTSFSCNDANDYLYNVSVLNGQLTGLCAADSTGGGGDGTGGWTNDTSITRTNLAVNITNGSIYLGNAIGDSANKYIYFREDGTDIGESLFWQDSADQFEITDGFYAWSDIKAGTDLMAVTSASRFWIGSSTESNANITMGTSNSIIQLRGSSGGINTTYLTVQNLNSGTSCDVKATSNGTVYCGTDADSGAGSGDGTGGWTNTTVNTSTNLYVYTTGKMFQYGNNPVRDMNMLFCDFTSSTYAVGACSPDFYGTVAGTGGISAIDTAPLGTRGVFSISRGTAANSGYTWGTHLSAFRIGGGEEFSTMMNFTLPTGINETRAILGFCDAAIATSGITLCSRGVWFNLTGNLTNGLNVSGMTNNAGTPTNSKTGFYRISPNQLYVFKIRVINMSRANFSIYHPMNNSYVWSEEVNSANFPKNTTAALGARVNVGETLAGTAGVRATIDYIQVEFEQIDSVQFNRFY